MIAKRAQLAAIITLGLGQSVAPAALAQAYPSHIIKLVVPFTVGSPNDVMARLLTRHLGPRLGQSIVINNKPMHHHTILEAPLGVRGASIGTKAAAADSDGYTLLFVSSALVIDPAMQHVAYNPLKDFTPIATVNTTPWLIAVSPTFPVKTVSEFVAYSRAHPGTINFAATQGTASILVAERFKQLSGAELSIIPYEGGAATLPDFLGGRIQVLNPTLSTSLAHIRAGKMRAIMITSPARSAELPDVATAREAGLPDLTLEFWAGVLAPAGTAPEVVAKVNAAINDTLRSPKMKETMSKLGMKAKIGSPEDYARFIAEETLRWNAVVKATGVKID